MKTMSRQPIRILSVLLLGCCWAGLVQATYLNLTLERSTDMQSWEKVPVHEGMLTAADEVEVSTDLPVYYRMRIQPAPYGGMVEVQGGTLVTSNELNGTVVDTFHIGRYEVTWGKWKTVRDWAAANGYDIGSRGDGCADDHPVHTVAWYDVVKWCNAKSEKNGLETVYGFYVFIGMQMVWVPHRSGESVPWARAANGYRLPLQAEWEFAARGGNQTNEYTYSGGNDLNAVGWYWDNSGGAACNLYEGRGTWPVGQKLANELRLYDMTGNVWEWCWDASGSGPERHFRGGSWGNSAWNCPVSGTYAIYPDYRSNSIGFRLARNTSP